MRLSTIEIDSAPKVAVQKQLQHQSYHKPLPKKTSKKKRIPHKQHTFKVKQPPKQHPTPHKPQKTVLAPVQQPHTALEVTEQNCTKTVQQPPMPMVHKQEYAQLHINEIATLIKENLYYPRRARKRGIEGEVRVRFTLQEDATITNIEILSSQSEILSRAAKQTLENLSKKLPKPDEVLTLTVPIKYSLD